MASTLNIRTVVSRPFEENTYLLWRQGSTDAVVVDPGLEPDLIFDALDEEGLTPAAILITHAHGDHIGGNTALKERYPDCPIIIGAGEAHMLTDARANLSAMFNMPIVSPPADRTVREGDAIEVAGIRFEILEVPGHSPGHVVYVHRSDPILVMGGDVLFRGSVGRTDLPGGSAALLFEGICTKIFPLPGNTVIYPGHGPVTTVAHERQHNPFVGIGN
jgi:glyoxylase-like metal-dependent hydrolase (beta-lactamase superfamily II)